MNMLNFKYPENLANEMKNFNHGKTMKMLLIFFTHLTNEFIISIHKQILN